MGQDRDFTLGYSVSKVLEKIQREVFSWQLYKLARNRRALWARYKDFRVINNIANNRP